MIVSYRPIDWIDWLPKDKYRVGDDGSVWRRLRNGEWRRLGGTKQSHEGRVVAVSHLGRVKKATIAYFVLRAFVGGCPIGCAPFRFPDRSLTNDSLANLKWAPKNSWNLGHPSRGSGSQAFKKGQDAYAKSLRSLREEDIPEIFDCRRQGWTHEEIGSRFCVPAKTIHNVLASRTYRAVPADRSAPKTPRRVPTRVLDSLDVLEIRTKVQQGEMQTNIAKEYGVSPSLICRILKGNRWSHVV